MITKKVDEHEKNEDKTKKYEFEYKNEDIKNHFLDDYCEQVLSFLVSNAGDGLLYSTDFDYTYSHKTYFCLKLCPRI